jgi:hypothetical protein
MMPVRGRAKVMVACVTFETVMIVDPFLKECPDRVHLIHYVKDPNDPSLKVYQEFYDEVCRLMISSAPDTEIVEHKAKVYDYQEMLRTVFNILLSESRAGSDILINVSSGTPEYSAASTVAAMMVPGTVPFTVGTKAYTTSEKDIRKLYYREGRPLGLTAETYDLKPMSTYKIDIPDEDLVRCLRGILMISKKSIPPRLLCINHLKDLGLWSFAPDDRKGKTDEKQKEKMYFGRHYLTPWMDRGWVEKNGKTYRITQLGEKVANTFYTQ